METKVRIGLISVFCFFMLTAGCEKQSILGTEPTAIPSTKQARLIAIENARLEEQVSRLRAKNVRCQESYENLKKSMSKDNKEAMENMMTGIVTFVGKENERLLKENGRLNTEIKRLQEHIEELEK